jgi:two-component system, NarL family, nitrate/nitrite response regulator NarL
MTGDTVLLIDANRLFCAGLERILADASFAVVHEAPSIEAALPFLEALRPSLVLVDLPASREAAVAGISRIREASAESRIVVLTETIRLSQMTDGLLGGVDGYLLKSISADALPQSLRLVLLGEKVFPTDLAQVLTKGRANGRGESGQLGDANGLSDREMEILGWLVNGAPNKRIAQALNISDSTVKVHIKAILRKIRVRNRTQAAIWALNNGFARDADMARDGAAPVPGAELPQSCAGK